MPADNVTNVRLGQNTPIAVNTSAASHVINSGMARIASEVDCHIAIGADPTATTNDPFMPRGVEYFPVPVGYKVALIKSAAASAGVGSVTTCHNP